MLKDVIENTVHAVVSGNCLSSSVQPEELAEVLVTSLNRIIFSDEFIELINEKIGEKI